MHGRHVHLNPGSLDAPQQGRQLEDPHCHWRRWGSPSNSLSASTHMGACDVHENFRRNASSPSTPSTPRTSSTWARAPGTSASTWSLHSKSYAHNVIATPSKSSVEAWARPRSQNMRFVAVSERLDQTPRRISMPRSVFNILLSFGGDHSRRLACGGWTRHPLLNRQNHRRGLQVAFLIQWARNPDVIFRQDTHGTPSETERHLRLLYK